MFHNFIIVILLFVNGLREIQNLQFFIVKIELFILSVPYNILKLKLYKLFDTITSR